jgi:hypothetical protein
MLAGHRVPSFRYIKQGDALADLIAIELTPSAFVPGAFFAKTRLINCANEIATPTAGQSLVGYGFPHLQETWPSSTPYRVGGTFVHAAAGPMYEATMELQVGHSGGPVLTDTGKLVGMMIGHTNGKARIVPASSICTLVN